MNKKNNIIRIIKIKNCYRKMNLKYVETKKINIHVK